MMTISEFDAAIVKVHESRSRLVAEKKEIEADLDDLNVTKNGQRITVSEWNFWRIDKKKKLARIERCLSDLKVKSIDLHARREAAKREEKERDQQGAVVEEVKRAEDAAMALRIQNRDLQKRIVDQEVEIIRLNRQLDATIRELNAIPLTIRR